MVETRQYEFSDFSLKEVGVRLCLREGEALYYNEPLDNAGAAAKVVGKMLSGLDREMAVVVNLNNKLQPINYSIVSIGTLNRTIMEVRDVFKTSILSNAGSIILLHNHPSGDPKPSREDRAVTEKMIAAGKLLGINVVDHIVVGLPPNNYYSLREKEPNLFREEIARGVLDNLFKEPESVVKRISEKKEEAARLKSERQAEKPAKKTIEASL